MHKVRFIAGKIDGCSCYLRRKTNPFGGKGLNDVSQIKLDLARFW